MASSSLLHEFQAGDAASAAPRDITTAGVGLAVLTRDDALVRAVQAIGSEYPVFPVGAESDLAAHLVASTTGVCILDVDTVASSVDRLSERLKSQFPDLILIVAGSVDDQSALATQITKGVIYRFLHKPVSEQRVKLFVDAAWRRHSEERGGAAPGSATTLPSREGRGAGRRNLLVLGVTGVIAAVLGGFLLIHKPDAPVVDTTPHAATQPAAPPEPQDPLLEADLARAEQSFTKGALVSPPGANAVDWYRQAMQRNPKDPRPAKGVEKVIDSLLSGAEAQLLAQHLDQAQQLTDQARAIEPDHVRVAFLRVQIGKERERAVLAQARQAAASGNIEQALAALDGANHDTQQSTLVTEARQELEHKQLDTRIREFLSRANERMRDGQLMEPAQDNARFYIESARTLAPGDTEVKQTQKLFLDRLVGEARKALATDNADQAQHWIEAASDAGVAPDVIAQLSQAAEQVRATVRADALAHLALLLEEARNAARRQDYVGAQRWLTEAHAAGADPATVAAINNDIKVAQAAQAAAEARKQADDVVSAASLQRVKYTPPEFPRTARDRSLSGWVDVQFLILPDGSISDVSVVAADPAGVFEAPATDAVRKWKYQPVMRDGKPINQRARVRVRFALQQ